MSETQSAPQALGLQAPPAPRGGRIAAARMIVFIQTPMLFLIGVLYLGKANPVVSVLCIAGSAVLLWGGIRMGRDSPVPCMQPLDRHGIRRVPWDWTDFLMFWPAAFTASTILVSLAVPAVDQFTGGDQTVRTAIESFVAQATFYAGALFTVYVLAGLRRGATVGDVGWRRFSWWWIPIGIAAAWATLYGAEVLQILSQHLFPSAQNSQCVAVQHDYSHFLVLAIIVVCVIAPISEETIFRGFVYGWLHRWSPAGVAIPVSAAIFAALHGVLLLFIPLFAVGCVLAIFFQYSRSLWPGAMVHALFNLPGIIAILSAASC